MNSPAKPSGKSSRWVIFFCALTAICEGIDLQAAGVSAPGLIQEFRPNPNVLGTFFSASTFGLLFGAVIGGRLSDRYGRKLVLVSSVAIFGFFSLAMPFASSFDELTWIRALTGVGLGGALPMMVAMAAEAAESRRRAGVVALVYCGAPVGGAIISGVSLLEGAAHWRSVYLVGGIVPLLLALLMAFALIETPAYRQAASLPQATASNLASIQRLFAEGLRQRTLLLWASFFLELLVLYLLLNWLPTLLLATGLTHSAASLAQIGFNVGGALTALAFAYCLGTRARQPAIFLVFCSIPFLVWSLSQAQGSVAIVVFVVLLIGGALSAAQGFLYSVAPSLYQTSVRGLGVGMAMAVGRIGSILGPKLAGALRGAGHSPSQMLIDILPLGIAGSISALLLSWRAKGMPAAEQDKNPL